MSWKAISLSLASHFFGLLSLLLAFLLLVDLVDIASSFED